MVVVVNILKHDLEDSHAVGDSAYNELREEGSDDDRPPPGPGLIRHCPREMARRHDNHLVTAE